MEFTPELSAFQGVIISADNVHPLPRLSAKGGNEETVKYIIYKLSTFLKETKCLDENGMIKQAEPQMRKYAMYILLNTDFPILEQMVEIEGIDCVIWTLPTIPKYLMTEMFWNLHMGKFVYEIITYTYPDLSLDIASAFIDNFKYFHPQECLDKLKILTEACYALVYRLYLFNFEESNLLHNLKLAQTNFKKCLQYFLSPPNSHKLHTLKSDEMYKYQGKRLQTMLNLIFECFGQYTDEQLRKPLDFDNMYMLTCKEGTLKNNPVINICESNDNDPILECLMNSHVEMLDTCKALVMEVSVDVFCAWSEFEEDDVSMQQTIGETCYKVRSQLLNISSVAEHPLVSMIEQITRKPAEMKDLINSTETDTIMENINNDGEEKKWLHALVEKENLCDNLELLEAINSNIEVFNEVEYYKLYKIFNKYLSSSSENEEYIKILLIKVFQRCHNAVKYELLGDHFNNNTFSDTKVTSHFSDLMTETFNKIIASTEGDFTEVLSIFIQKPSEIYNKIFYLASENVHQTGIMLGVMKALEKYSNYYYTNDTEPCVIKVTQNIFENMLETEVKQNNFIKFLCGLKTLDIIPKTKLLLLIIMPNMHKALLEKDIQNLHIQLKLLKQAFLLEELLEYGAPMLAMLARVLDIVRWKINSFSPLAPNALEEALQLQTLLMNKYDNDITEKECNWLKSKIHYLQPLNMYYYRKLWNPPGKNYLEVISGMNIDSGIENEELTKWLTQILSSCTQQEWSKIWEGLIVLGEDSALKILQDALNLIIVAEVPNRTEATWACLLHCFTNLIFIIRYKYFVEPLSDIQVVTAIDSLVSTTKIINAENVEDIGNLLLPLFAYLVERKSDFTINLSKQLHDDFKDTSMSPIINKVFSNGTE